MADDTQLMIIPPVTAGDADGAGAVSVLDMVLVGRHSTG